MSKRNFLVLLFIALLGFIPISDLKACSGYKITKGSKTVFGSNEDAWRLTPHLWFENASPQYKFGAAFTGSRFDGDNGYAPQTGMNEKGLAFERLASYHPKMEGPTADNKKIITNPTQYLKDILHNCKTVAEVATFIRRYDHSYFIEDLFVYADQSGKYLIVEPYTLTFGHDSAYVFSNFCPSITPNTKARTLARYRNGYDYLQNGYDTMLSFYTALSDTMHVCRGKIGDGTLLTSIWELNEGRFHLCFYHRYDTVVSFNLQEELAKGDRLVFIADLFPKNAEFEKLDEFKTPKNSPWLGVFIVFLAPFFLLGSFVYLRQLMKRKADTKYRPLLVLLIALNLVLVYYIFVLSGSIRVFYFDAPYRDPANIFVSLSSYLPFVLLFCLPFLLGINYRLLHEKSWGRTTKIFFTANNITFVALLGLFWYWGFYVIF